MSELKAISSGEIYKIIEYEDCYRTDDLYYPKSEADKVIAELKDKLRHYPMMVALLESDKTEIAELKAQKAQAEDDCAYWKTKAQRERHHKYRRCLAMAKWCVGKYENYSLLANEACQRGCYKSEARWDRQADKWLSRKSRWLKLAEKFKEAK